MVELIRNDEVRPLADAARWWGNEADDEAWELLAEGVDRQPTEGETVGKGTKDSVVRRLHLVR